MQSSIYIYIYIYNSVDLNLSVRKLLPQLACDRHETPGYYGVLHGGDHRRVHGSRFAAPEQSATQFPSITEKDAMFFVCLLQFLALINFMSIN